MMSKMFNLWSIFIYIITIHFDNYGYRAGHTDSVCKGYYTITFLSRGRDKIYASHLLHYWNS